jgi:hypothetical protein
MRTSLAATARSFLRWEFVPEAVLFAGLTAFFFHQNDAAASAFKSTKAVAIMAAVGLGWLAARVALARLVRFALARAAVFSVAAAVALSVVVLPAYNTTTIVETFPTTTAPAPIGAPESAAVPTATPMPDAPAEMAAPMATQPAPASAQKKPAPAPTTTTTVAPAPDPAAAAPATTSTTSSAQPEVVTSPPTEPAPVPAPASGPQRLRSGSFRGIDHRASGTVAIYRQPDGRYVVGLEDFDIQPGPDYDVYLVPGENREETKGGVRLGDLRANRGTLFYDVPAGIDLENGPWTVLVWCQTFAVPVANSTPS